MLLHIPNLLNLEEVRTARSTLGDAAWIDGKNTAGAQAGLAKKNEQLSQESPASLPLQRLVLNALNNNSLFFSATLPKRIYPPQFNRYGGHSNTYGKHVDGAVMYVKGTGERVRSDVSCTLFLS
ncbi:MAG: PKHD-type hydroxylase, partial [Verrucomicrobiaceae bacterium]